MHKNTDRLVRNFFRALLGPRYTWGLAARTRRLTDDLPGRLNDALHRISLKARADDEQPVFVFSAGWRSGSTLLQRMIMENNKDLLLWGEPFAHSNIHDGLVDQFRAFTSEWPPGKFFLSRTALKDLSDTWVANLYPDVDDLLRAHRNFHGALFADPAHRAGWKNWGIKEVRLTIDHATYLRILYPKCKILMLYRNPYHAYLSYRNWGVTLFRTWPHRFISTPYAFGRNWAELTRGYLDGHERVDAFMIKYEDLDSAPAVERMQTYLGWPLPRSSQMRVIRDAEYSGSARPLRRDSLSAPDRALLKLATRSVLHEAGYRE